MTLKGAKANYRAQTVPSFPVVFSVFCLSFAPFFFTERANIKDIVANLCTHALTIFACGSIQLKRILNRKYIVYKKSPSVMHVHKNRFLSLFIDLRNTPRRAMRKKINVKIFDIVVL